MNCFACNKSKVMAALNPATGLKQIKLKCNDRDVKFSVSGTKVFNQQSRRYDIVEGGELIRPVCKI